MAEKNKYAGNQAVIETIKALRKILGDVSPAGIEECGNYIDGGGQSFTSALFALDNALSEKSLYDGIINIDTTLESVYLEGAIANVEVYGSSLKGYSTGLFDYLNDGIITQDEGRYKLVFGDVYVGDCIIEAIDTSKGNYRITIKRVAGSDYYFGKAQQFMLYDGEEYYSSTYYDIFLFDVNSIGGGYDKHVINHNPHKNDDFTVTTRASVLSFSYDPQGISKILDEYYEGCRKFDYSSGEVNKSLLPVISGNSSAFFVLDNLNSSSETSVVYLDAYFIGALFEEYLLEPYLFKLASGSAEDLLTVIPKKTVHLFNDGTEKDVPIAPVIDVLQWSEGFDERTDAFSVHLKPYEHCEIEIIAGSLESEVPDLGGPAVYATRGFVNLKRHAPTKTSQLTNDSGFLKEAVTVTDFDNTTIPLTKGVVEIGDSTIDAVVLTLVYETNLRKQLAYDCFSDNIYTRYYQDAWDTWTKVTTANDFKTVNGQSIVGRGNIAIEGGSAGGAYPQVDANPDGEVLVTIVIEPNKFYLFGDVVTLDIGFGEETEGVANEYLFQFSSGSSEATTLLLPNSVKWANDEVPTIETNMIYQVSILNGLATMLAFSNTPELDTFFISGYTSYEYQCVPGMTWEEWINSEYNVDGYFVNSGYVHQSSSYRIRNNGVDVLATDTIIANNTYNMYYYD